MKIVRFCAFRETRFKPPALRNDGCFYAKNATSYASVSFFEPILYRSTRGGREIKKTLLIFHRRHSGRNSSTRSQLTELKTVLRNLFFRKCDLQRDSQRRTQRSLARNLRRQRCIVECRAPNLRQMEIVLLSRLASLRPVNSPRHYNVNNAHFESTSRLTSNHPTCRLIKWAVSTPASLSVPDAFLRVPFPPTRFSFHLISPRDDARRFRSVTRNERRENWSVRNFHRSYVFEIIFPF